MFEYKRKTLDNGLRVVFVPMDLTSVVVNLYVGAGGKYEKEEEHGLAHFLEHMAFKGTEKRPDPLTMAKELDKIGAIYNASTSKDRISYWIKNTPKHLDLMFDFVSDIVFNARMEEKEINREKGVILEEINMYEDTPKAKVEDLFSQLVLGDNLLGRSGLGTKKSVKKFSRSDFVGYKKRLFSPKNMVLAVAGNSNQEKVFGLAKKWFGQYQVDFQEPEPVDWKPEKKKVLVDKRKTEQTHLILGRSIFGFEDDRRWPMGILKNILGSGMSSRLWSEIREKRGWAYYVYASVGYYQEGGLFGISAGVRNNKAQEAVEIIKEELLNISQTMTKEEFNDAKEGLRGRILLSVESTTNLAGWSADSWLREGKIRTVKETLDLIESVKIEEVKNLAGDLFQPGEFYLAAISPKENLTIDI
jgi:predicted Zn-dependent peptidase